MSLYPPAIVAARQAMAGGNMLQALQHAWPTTPTEADDAYQVHLALTLITFLYPAHEWPSRMAPVAHLATHGFTQWMTATRQAIGARLADTPDEFAQLAHQAYTLMQSLKQTQLPSRTPDEALDLHKAFLFNKAYTFLLNALLPHPAPQPNDLPTLYMVGDSHVLSPHGQTVEWQGESWQLKSLLTMGCKLHHLCANGSDYHRHIVARTLQILPPNAPVLLSLGEIDCRPTEGIWAHAHQHGYSPTQIASRTFAEAATWLKSALQNRPTLLCGIPATPAARLAKHLQTEAEQTAFAAFTHQANTLLAQTAARQGWGFLDCFALTADPLTHISHNRWHLEKTHLLPTAIAEAFRAHATPA